MWKISKAFSTPWRFPPHYLAGGEGHILGTWYETNSNSTPFLSQYRFWLLSPKLRSTSHLWGTEFRLIRWCLKNTDITWDTLKIVKFFKDLLKKMKTLWKYVNLKQWCLKFWWKSLRCNIFVFLKSYILETSIR